MKKTIIFISLLILSFTTLKAENQEKINQYINKYRFIPNHHYAYLTNILDKEDNNKLVMYLFRCEGIKYSKNKIYENKQDSVRAYYYPDEENGEVTINAGKEDVENYEGTMCWIMSKTTPEKVIEIAKNIKELLEASNNLDHYYTLVETGDWMTFGKINEEYYVIQFNKNGAILKNTATHENIYLGISQDAFSSQYGKGVWKTDKNGLTISFKNNIFTSSTDIYYHKDYSNDTYSKKLMLLTEGFLLEGQPQGYWYEYNSYDKFLEKYDSLDYRGFILSKTFYKNNMTYETEYDTSSQFMGYIITSNKDNTSKGIAKLSMLKTINNRYYYGNNLYNGIYFSTAYMNIYGVKVSKVGIIEDGIISKEKISKDNLYKIIHSLDLIDSEDLDTIDSYLNPENNN